jgi:hypothetical protein
MLSETHRKLYEAKICPSIIYFFISVFNNSKQAPEVTATLILFSAEFRKYVLRKLQYNTLLVQSLLCINEKNIKVNVENIFDLWWKLKPSVMGCYKYILILILDPSESQNLKYQQRNC